MELDLRVLRLYAKQRQVYVLFMDVICMYYLMLSLNYGNGFYKFNGFNDLYMKLVLILKKEWIE